MSREANRDGRPGPDPIIEAIHAEVARLGTLQAVAREFGISRPYLSRILRGACQAGKRTRRLLMHRGHRPLGRVENADALLAYVDSLLVSRGGIVHTLARELGVDDRFLQRVIEREVGIGRKIPLKLGYRAVLMYERIKP